MWISPLTDAAGEWSAQEFTMLNTSGTDGVAYIGLQPGSTKTVRFSIWGGTGGEVSSGGSFEFSNENGNFAGMSYPYDWSTSDTYRVRLWVDVCANSAVGWQAWVYSSNNNTDTYVGCINVPSTWGWINDYTAGTWSEWYGNVTDCAYINDLDHLKWQERNGGSTAYDRVPYNYYSYVDNSYVNSLPRDCQTSYSTTYSYDGFYWVEHQIQ
jgi:hypothetical protein